MFTLSENENIWVFYAHRQFLYILITIFPNNTAKTNDIYYIAFAQSDNTLEKRDSEAPKPMTRTA